jgi:hypothetical protein
MTKIFLTIDRALALRCKRAHIEGKKITVNYETQGGWNRASGIVQSVRKFRTSPIKPCWEIIIGKPTITVDQKPCDDPGGETTPYADVASG